MATDGFSCNKANRSVVFFDKNIGKFMPSLVSDCHHLFQIAHQTMRNVVLLALSRQLLPPHVKLVIPVNRSPSVLPG